MKTKILNWYLNNNQQNGNKKVNESIIDLAKDKLCPEVWENGKIKREIREIILNKIKEIVKLLNLNKDKILSVTVFGSITQYNYNKYTDIDVHIIYQEDFTNEDEKEKKEKEYNNKIDQHLGTTYIYSNALGEDFNHPFNFYIEISSGNKYPIDIGGIYDLLNDEWIQNPNEIKFQCDFLSFEISTNWARKLDMSIQELKRDIIEYLLYKSEINYSKKQDIEIILPEKELLKMIEQKEKEIIYDAMDIATTIGFLKDLRKESHKKTTKYFLNKQNLEKIKKDKIIKIDENNLDVFLGTIIWKNLYRWGYFKFTSKIRKIISQYKDNKISEKQMIDKIIKNAVPQNWWKITESEK